MHILTINAGSSSIKFALFQSGNLQEILRGGIEKIGWPEADFYVGKIDGQIQQDKIMASDHIAALHIFNNWLENNISRADIIAVGHRVVHGGDKYQDPQFINDEVVAELKTLIDLDPEHLPLEISLIEEARRLFPSAQQVAVFDTTFHKNLPVVARLLPIPRRYERLGLRRYGFHGLSCAYVMGELAKQNPNLAAGRVIIAHLGNGVSLTAVSGGGSIDTTMSLTPASGVPMSSRAGDLDPGLAYLLAKNEGMDAEKYNKMVNFESGLLGISETTADMEQLLAKEADDAKAKDAVDVFCYQVKKSIGALSASLGGLDALIFTGGMGEKAPKIRARICAGLEFLGVDINQADNNDNAEIISAPASKVTIRIIKAVEEAAMADEVGRLISKEVS